MAFKLTYSDGQESQHGDDTVWEIDDGVLKLGRKKGRKKGQWSVLLSPSHWAVLEVVGESRDSEDSDEPDDEDGSGDSGDSDRDSADKDKNRNDKSDDKSDGEDD
ncbi:hypothetical protein [Mycolicibacterium austroafricanum]|uniref:hypothetical protein n=1 Tax=Mycolicibacterium austroafricanum TaxID=39687 RepID=UPI001CA349C9|nr:hypothetical protein [Mycolicibacterium austroafricanum]QZT61981.1 hypothetical protein JN085_24120 [Mycolicibacterium austroafricanum]